MGQLLQMGVAPIFDMEVPRRALFQPERPVFTLAGPHQMSAEDDRQSRELTNQVLIQIRDNLAQINRKQDAFGEEQNAQGNRIVRLEERNERMTRLEAAQEKVAGQVELLIADKHKRDGAIGVWSWLSNNWPTAGLITALGAFVAWANGFFK